MSDLELLLTSVYPAKTNMGVALICFSKFTMDLLNENDRRQISTEDEPRCDIAYGCQDGVAALLSASVMVM